MAELIHLSKFRIVQEKRPLRRAYLEGFKDPIEFGVSTQSRNVRFFAR